MSYILQRESIDQFIAYLRHEEHAESTIQKYQKILLSFYAKLPESGQVDKEAVLAWREQLAGQCSVSTVNGKIAAVNGLLAFLGWHDCRVKPLKQQKKIFRDKERELTQKEYVRLLDTAKASGNMRLYYIMETLCSTGIRISELSFITVEALKAGRATVRCKGKLRTVILIKKLRRVLEQYCREQKIKRGPVFVTQSGKPVNRSNVWKEMQKLCAAAKVEPKKVFPHNFRHLFAVAMYRMEKDIAKLADLLGHASIETTRIYIMESGAEHERQVERLGLVV
jgi:site-specific recombinase XerD